MKIRVYVSRSFHEEDRFVRDAILSALENPAITNRCSVEVYDSEPAQDGQLFDRIRSDISVAHWVVCIYTRRHTVEGNQYVPAPYVVSEASFALALNKELALFVEQGIKKADLGLIDARNDRLFEFDRSKVDTAKFQESVVQFFEKKLSRFQQTARRAHHFRKYMVHHTVYPNGYALTHFKADVEVVDHGKKRPVEFFLQPSEAAAKDTALPSNQELVAAGAASDFPVPIRPFVAFHAKQPGVKFRPLSRRGDEHRRTFEVEFPAAGEFQYQWAFGSPRFLELGDELNPLLILATRVGVSRLEVLLRIHRALKRPSIPRMVSAVGGTTLDMSDAQALSRWYGDGEDSPESESHPLYRCYWFDVNVNPGVDALLLY